MMLAAQAAAAARVVQARAAPALWLRENDSWRRHRSRSPSTVPLRVWVQQQRASPSKMTLHLLHLLTTAAMAAMPLSLRWRMRPLAESAQAQGEAAMLAEALCPSCPMPAAHKALQGELPMAQALCQLCQVAAAQDASLHCRLLRSLRLEAEPCSCPLPLVLQVGHCPR